MVALRPQIARQVTAHQIQSARASVLVCKDLARYKDLFRIAYEPVAHEGLLCKTHFLYAHKTPVVPVLFSHSNQSIVLQRGDEFEVLGCGKPTIHSHKSKFQLVAEAVSKWLDEQSPEIAKRAKQVGAEIHWGDETGLRSDDVRGRGYAPKGETAVLRARPGKEGEDGARSAEVAAKIEMVGCGGVEVYCSLGQTLTKHLGIELQITLRIGSNRSDVKQTDYRIHTDLSWVKRNHEQFCSSVVLAGTGQRGSRGKQV